MKTNIASCNGKLFGLRFDHPSDPQLKCQSQIRVFARFSDLHVRIQGSPRLLKLAVDCVASIRRLGQDIMAEICSDTSTGSGN